MKRCSLLFAAPALAGLVLLTDSSQPASAQAQAGSVAVGSATIVYRVQGHGPAMMLVHGYPLSGELFAKNAPCWPAAVRS